MVGISLFTLDGVELVQRVEQRLVVPTRLPMMPQLSLRVNSMIRLRTIGLIAKISFVYQSIILGWKWTMLKLGKTPQ